MIKIVVTSPSFSKNKVLRTKLDNHFSNVTYNLIGANLAANELADFIGDADGVILGLEIADSQLFDRCKNLKIISKYGVGLNNIDLNAASNSGIKVSYTSGVNKRSVSELVLSFMFGISRNVFESITHMKNGQWIKDGGREVSGKKIGIIGFGNVGQDLAKLLMPLGVDIYACDIVDFEEKGQYYYVTKVEIDVLLKECDVITLHLPYNSSTHHLISARQFLLMKDTAIIINTSRGGIIDEKALLEALSNKNILAALDVFEIEPQVKTELVEHPRIFPTPHIGGNSREAVLSMGITAINNLTKYFRL